MSEENTTEETVLPEPSPDATPVPPSAPAEPKKFRDTLTQEICTLEKVTVPVDGDKDGKTDTVVFAYYAGGHVRAIEGSLERFVEILPVDPKVIAPKQGGAEPVTA